MSLYAAWLDAEARAAFWQRAYLSASHVERAAETAIPEEFMRVELPRLEGRRRRRVRAARERPAGSPESDKKSLDVREKESLELLSGTGIDGETLTLRDAIELHRNTDDKTVRLALRVAVARSSVNGIPEDRRYWLDLFYVDLASELDRLALAEEEETILRSCFLKAAHHRAAPERHSAVD